jgi:PAS domain S-box-containing protein
MNEPAQAHAPPPADYAELLQRLIEAEDTLYAIRTGDVDALMMGGQVYSLEGAETPYRLLIEAMGEGAGTLTLDGTVLYANRRLSELLAVPLAELIGAALRSWVTAADQATFDRWLSEGLHHPITGELTFLSRTGTGVSTQVAINRIPSTGGPILGLVVSDLTERKQAETEIRTLNTELEQRVRSRTTELEAANTELEAFVYTVAHDLRAPLRSIDGFSRILLEDCGDRLQPEEKGHLERVRMATQHMGHLIESMLQLSRLNRSELRRTAVDISALAQGVFADLQRQDPERRVVALVAPDLVAQADPALIHSVLENLLGNAWKFTSKTVDARIELGCVKQDGVPTFFVHDNGAGFNMAYRGKLFGVFQRLHRNDEFPGTGVGLASVQRIIHRHKGRVWAESEPGNGASFFFTLEPTPKHHE